MGFGERGKLGISAIMVALGILLWLLTGSVSLGDDVTPTTEWINLYSTDSTWNGEKLPVGSRVAVLDAQGTRCGEFEVTQEGWYGYMPCYRDDPMTALDEGASVGEELHFTVDGEEATATAMTLNGISTPSSTLVTWTATGDRWEVKLEGSADRRPVGGRTLAFEQPPLRWSRRGATWVIGLGLPVSAVIVALATRARRTRNDAATR